MHGASPLHSAHFAEKHRYAGQVVEGREDGRAHLRVMRHMIMDMMRHVTVGMMRHVILGMIRHVIVDMMRHVTVDMMRHVILGMMRHVIAPSARAHLFGHGVGQLHRELVCMCVCMCAHMCMVCVRVYVYACVHVSVICCTDRTAVWRRRGKIPRPALPP